ncbi:MAG: hypothetical protein WEC17_00625 [Candidatus Saccharimonadales bacterium]
MGSERLSGSAEQRQLKISYEEVSSRPDIFGYTAGTDEEGFYAYGPPLKEDKDDDKFHKLTTEPVETEDQALEILVDYLNKTYAGEGLK